IVERQAEPDEGAVSDRDVGASGEQRRERAHLAAALTLELGRAHLAGVRQARDLAVELEHGTLGGVGAYRRDGAEHARVARVAEAGARAVRPALGLAQVEVDAAGE